MAFQIKGLDLNPNAGDSWMGLTREQSKFIATMFIVTGLFLADPPFSILPTDIINIWLGGGISQHFGIPLGLSILLTYTVIAWGLVFTGIWIYPYDSRRLLSGYINKFKRLLRLALRKPIFLVAGVVLFYFMFMWYKGQIVLEELIPPTSALLTQATQETVVFMVMLVMIMFILGNDRWER